MPNKGPNPKFKLRFLVSSSTALLSTLSRSAAPSPGTPDRAGVRVISNVERSSTNQIPPSFASRRSLVAAATPFVPPFLHSSPIAFSAADAPQRDTFLRRAWCTDRVTPCRSMASAIPASRAARAPRVAGLLVDDPDCVTRAMPNDQWRTKDQIPTPRAED
jgi:hypothetical protein